MSVERSSKKSRLFSYRREQFLERATRPIRSHNLHNYPIVLPKEHDVDPVTKTFISAEDSRWVHLHLAKMYRASAKSKYSDEEKAQILEKSRIAKEKIKMLDSRQKKKTNKSPTVDLPEADEETPLVPKELTKEEPVKVRSAKAEPKIAIDELRQIKSSSVTWDQGVEDLKSFQAKLEDSIAEEESKFKFSLKGLLGLGAMGKKGGKSSEKLFPVAGAPANPEPQGSKTMKLKKSVTLIRMLGFLNKPTNNPTVLPTLPSLTRKIGIQERDDSVTEQRHQNDRKHHLKMNEKLKQQRQLLYQTLKNQMLYQEVIDKVERQQLLPAQNTGMSYSDGRRRKPSDGGGGGAGGQPMQSKFANAQISSLGLNEDSNSTSMSSNQLEISSNDNLESPEPAATTPKQPVKKKPVSIFMADDEESEKPGENEEEQRSVRDTDSKRYHGLGISDLIERRDVGASHNAMELGALIESNESVPVDNPTMAKSDKKSAQPLIPLTMETLILSNDVKIVQPLRYRLGKFLPTT